jgi:GMP synthase-like glutamine amidotransferase
MPRAPIECDVIVLKSRAVMKPIAVFRHLSMEGPGHFATFLERLSVPIRLIAVDRGDPIPLDPTAYSGLCFMGGPMSANDPLAWIGESLALIRRAVETGVPVLGHCLGGQLMAKALGGEVTVNPVKEIGWGKVLVVPGSAAEQWLGDVTSFTAFHWHGETFSIPPGANRLLASSHCANQAFALGPHLALQCHVEMTPEMIAEWARHGAGEIARRRPQDAIQTGEEMLLATPAQLPGMQAIAERLYGRWLGSLPR